MKLAKSAAESIIVTSAQSTRCGTCTTLRHDQELKKKIQEGREWVQRSEEAQKTQILESQDTQTRLQKAQERLSKERKAEEEQ